ncbi:hypothetical protein FKM82_006245 [Ascaphus truei]
MNFRSFVSFLVNCVNMYWSHINKIHRAYMYQCLLPAKLMHETLVTGTIATSGSFPPYNQERVFAPVLQPRDFHTYPP